jgi:hypothetical protein
MYKSGKPNYVPFTKKEGKRITNFVSWAILCEAKAAFYKEETFFTIQMDLILSKKQKKCYI